MSKPVDLELKQAFNEVQKKMLDTSNKLKLCSFEIKRHEMEIHDNKKVLTELKELSDDTSVYETVGRAFVTCNLNYSRENIKNEIEQEKEKVYQIKEKEKELRISLVNSEQYLREMIQKKQLPM